MSDNMFAHSTTRGPLTRVATGIGLTLAAIATIGLGAGPAAAAPQQPFAADDPIPGMPGAGSAVNIANSIFGSLSGLMNNVIPGAGDLLMPATSALGGGGGIPGLGGGLPGGLPGGLGGGLPGGLPADWWTARAGFPAVSRVKPPGSAATRAALQGRHCRDKPRAACPVRCPAGSPARPPVTPAAFLGSSSRARPPEWPATPAALRPDWRQDKHRASPAR